MTERTFHPEGTALDGGERGHILSLVDHDSGATVGQLRVNPSEWAQLKSAGVDYLFSGQVPNITWADAEHAVRAVLGRGFAV